MNTGFAADFDRRGFALVSACVDHNQIDGLKEALNMPGLARSERGGATYGIRNLLGLEVVRQVADAPVIAAHLLLLMGANCKPVRGIFFDKAVGANWPVPWHQDMSLAVHKSREVEGWTNWSVKRGIPHARPPAEILDRMVTMRLHLDDCPVDNGALRLLPGSHRAGLLSREAVQGMEGAKSEIIVASAGDALFMRPLILHASSPAKAPSHRRVLHLEFAPQDLLPEGLEWAAA